MDAREWQVIFDRQCLVATTRQCVLAGISHRLIARRVAADRWLRPHPGVVVMGTGPLTEEQRIWAALLAITGMVAASHETALWLADRRARPPRQVHVAVREGRRVLPLEGVCVHHLPDLGHDRVLWREWPPRVVTEHAVVDLGRLCRAPAAVVDLVTDVVGRRLTTAPRLAVVLRARPRMRWRSLWEALLTDVAEGAQSPLEIADLRNDRRHGLPTGWRQEPVRRNGRAEWLDVRYQLPPPGRSVVKELDGRIGHGPGETHRDMGRDNAAVLRGGLPLRFGYKDMVGLPCEAAALQALVFQTQGWDGVPRLCGPTCRIAAVMRRLAAESGLPPPRTP